MKKATIIVHSNSTVDVTLEGDHLRKRELMLAIRALKRQHRESIRLYRKKLITENREKLKELQDDTGRNSSIEEQAETRTVTEDARADDNRTTAESNSGIDKDGEGTKRSRNSSSDAENKETDGRSPAEIIRERAEAARRSQHKEAVG